MASRISPDHPLRVLFCDLVDEEVARHLNSSPPGRVRDYVVDLLVDFVRTDSIFLLTSDDGRPLQSIIEMMAEGDIRLKASSFDRERQVHKHIGDYILFWSGVYPDFLRRLKVADGGELVCDYIRQGKESYHLVSTFDHNPYQAEAPTFRELSEEFEAYAFVLGQVGRKANLYAA